MGFNILRDLLFFFMLKFLLVENFVMLGHHLLLDCSVLVNFKLVSPPKMVYSFRSLASRKTPYRVVFFFRSPIQVEKLYLVHQKQEY